MAVVRIDLEVDASGAASIKGVAGQLKDLGAQGKSAQGAIASIFQGIGQGAGQEIFRALKGLPSAIGEAAKAAIDYGSRLVDLRARTAVAIEAQQELAHAGKLVGVSFEGDVVPALAKMQKALVDTPEKFARLGLSISDLRKMKPEDQFEAIAAKIAEIKDPAERSTAAMEIFGKSGATLLPLLTSNIKAAREEAEALGLVMSTDVAESADDLGDSIDTLSSVWDGLIRNFGAAIVTSEPLHLLIKGLTQIIGDFSKEVHGSQSTLREFVDGGVVFVAQAFVQLVKGVSLVVDAWSGMKIMGITLGASFEELGQKSYLLYQVLTRQISAKDALKTAEQGALDITNRANAEIAEEMRANTERQAIVTKVQGVFEKLVTTVANSVGVTHKATLEEKDHTKALGEGAAALKERERIEKIVAETAGKIRVEAIKAVDKQIEDEYRRSEKVIEEIRAGQERANEIEARGIEVAVRLLERKAEKYRILSDGAAELARIVGGTLGTALGGVSQILDGLAQKEQRAADNLANYGTKALTAAQKIQAVVGAVLALAAAYKAGEQSGNKFGSTLGGAASGAATGAAIGGVPGAIIGGVLGGAAGYLGAASGQKKMLQELRAEYNAMVLAAERAGVAMKIALDPKTPQQYKDAIDEIKRALDTQAEAQQDLNDTVKEYGFTIEELGPAWAAQELEPQAAKLYKQWQLLNAAGVDHGAIIERVGPKVGNLVDQYVSAGVEIPQAMKPILDDLYTHHKLLHENGEEYTEAEYKGLKYTTTMSQMFTDLVKSVKDLVDAINNMVLKDKTFKITPVYQGGGGGGPNPNGTGNPYGPGNEPPPGLNYDGTQDHDGDPSTGNGYALGGSFWTRRRSRYAGRTIGENGEPELVTVQTKAQVMRGGGGGPATIVIPVSIGGQKLDEVIIRRVQGGYIRVPA